MASTKNVDGRTVNAMVHQYEINGKSAAWIAERFGLSVTTVLYHLRQRNVEIRPRGRGRQPAFA